MLKKINWSLVLILVGLLQWKTDRWWPQWVGLVVVLGFMFATWLIPYLGIPLSLLSLYSFIQFAFLTMVFTRIPIFADFQRETDRLILRSQGLEFFVYASIFILLVLYQQSPRRFNTGVFFKRLYWAILFTTAVTYVLGYGFEGYLGNWGMNICLLVCLTPFVPRFMWFISGTLVLLSGASTAYAVGAAVLFSEFRGRWRMVIPGLICVALIAGFMNPGLLNDSERFKNWILYWNYWKQNSLLFGFGPGSMGPIGPYLQGINGERQNWLLWAHNEYLQILFEFGICGFVLFALSCWSILSSSYTRLKPYFSLFIGVLTCAITNYPFRLALFMTVTVLAISEVLYDRKRT